MKFLTIDNFSSVKNIIWALTYIVATSGEQGYFKGISEARRGNLMTDTNSILTTIGNVEESPQGVSYIFNGHIIAYSFC